MLLITKLGCYLSKFQSTYMDTRLYLALANTDGKDNSTPEVPDRPPGLQSPMLMTCSKSQCGNRRLTLPRQVVLKSLPL